jgi:tetratricopeptide (TPR) repeat protein
MSTLALAMIVKDALVIPDIVDKYEQFFDKLYITVAAKTEPENGLNHPKLVQSYFKWIDHFGKAREFNRQQVTADYWFWMDDDDEIDHPEQLRSLVDYMDKNQLDVAYLKYDYFQNEAGEGVNDHWRERIIRTDSQLAWADVPVHETLIAPYARTQRFADVTVLHHKTLEAIEASHKRNAKLLKKHWKDTKDPRTAFYLGMEHMAAQDYEPAIEMFHFLIDNGGWDEEKYDAWCKIADCYVLEGHDAGALVATNMATSLNPATPDAYWQKVFIYGRNEQYDKAVEWAKVAMSKQAPDTLRMVDPTLYKYRGLFMTAQCYLFNGDIKNAWQLYNETNAVAPHFIKEQSEQTGVPWSKLFEEAYLDQKAVDYTRWLLRYTKDFAGKPQKVMEALPFRIFQDPRLNAERAKVFPPKKWPKKSIVFFCGQSPEAWGPDTLAKGMGGSEEAIVYLSRELAKLGWQVTVFNDRDDEYSDSGVTYLPWTLLNPYDEFDVFVAWRQAQNAVNVKARVLAVDLHDTPIGHVTVTPEQVKQVDKFFLKSNYQRELSATPIPDDKAVIIGNGIKAEQFS